MRLATFNLLHGRSLTDGLVDPDRLTAAVTALDADVLALQEVDRDQTRSGHLDITAHAARALHAPHHRFAAAVVGTPGEQFRPLTHDDDGHGEPLYGVGLISRHPVRSWHVTRLRAAPVRSPIYVPGPGGGLLLLRDEPRVVLAAVLDTPTAPHRRRHPPLLRPRLEHLATPPRRPRPTHAARPRILLGDLNLPAGPAAAVTHWRPLARLATYPAGQPRVQLDHVLADPHHLDRLPPVTAVDTPPSTVSDHRPLVVDLG
ncbi:endonuclease/exonuclease/phosphatase family protein [Micromonospora robiginosa]|uniref:Endonuclease/exonuclease/phosphatase family protein n=1 Tax=Micromonospora robiginosa TaxID=2749844 RepID=A0AAF0P2V1_9ACTN|nr:endonuclease/exonuclease/phosphatase family protein [Micromonospora ferruginea]WMF04519.1 endonuclease/exonuclease/phosphatase family protein [Micromonospora ferruginea]